MFVRIALAERVQIKTWYFTIKFCKRSKEETLAIATETSILQKIALLSKQYSHLAPKLEQWRQVRQQLAKRCFDIPTPEQSAYYQSEIDSLRQQAETLERELNIPELNLQIFEEFSLLKYL